MAPLSAQGNKDALYIFQTLKHIESDIVFDAREIAKCEGGKPDTVRKRFDAMRKRHGLKIRTKNTAEVDENGKVVQRPRSAAKTPPKRKASEACGEKEDNDEKENSSPSKKAKPPRRERKPPVKKLSYNEYWKLSDDDVEEGKGFEKVPEAIEEQYFLGDTKHA